MELDRPYRLCTTSFIAEGKDGYDVFKDCKVLVEEENGLPIQTAIRNHFRFLGVLSRWDPKCKVQKFARSLSDRASLRLAERQSSGGGETDLSAVADRAVREEGSTLGSTLPKIEEHKVNNNLDDRVSLSTRPSGALGQRKLQTTLSMQYQLPELNKGINMLEYAGLACLADGAYVVGPECDGRITVIESSR